MKKYYGMALAMMMATSVVNASTGELNQNAKALHQSNKDSVLFMSAVLEIEVTAGTNPTKKEEKKVEALVTVLREDGLAVLPLSSIDIASQLDGKSVNTAQGMITINAKCNTKEVKFIKPDGSEVPAKVVYKDVDLDLAFIRPEKPEEAKLTPISTKELGHLGVLDDMIILGRMGKDFNREPVVATSEVFAKMTKPRVYLKSDFQPMGAPVFDRNGKFAGLCVNRFTSKGMTDDTTGPVSAILPADDVMEAVAQVKDAK